MLRTSSYLRLSLFLIIAIACVCEPCLGAKRPVPPPRMFHSIDVALRDARQLEVHRFAPKHFAAVVEAYDKLRKAQRAGRLGVDSTRARAEEILALLREARHAAHEVRELVAEAYRQRRDIAKLENIQISQKALKNADRFFTEAIRAAEEGHREAAGKAEAKAALIYREAVLEAIEADLIRPAEIEIGKAFPYVSSASIKAAKRHLEFSREEIYEVRKKDFDIATLNRKVNAQIKEISDILFPPFYHNPPRTIQIGDFVLYVQHYETRGWDFNRKVITNASGIAWTDFHCAWPTFTFFFDPSIELIEKEFRIIETVKQPANEITLAEAKRIDPSLRIGEKIALSVPSDLRLDIPLTAYRLSEALRIPEDKLIDIFKWRGKGTIRMRFQDLTIESTDQADVGKVVEGSATYPTVPTIPSPIRLKIGGLTVLIDELVITPKKATARVELELPPSIVDPSVCHAARIHLDKVTIDASCGFYKELPNANFGPWVTESGMIIQGKGVVADFSTDWTYSGWSGPFYMLAAWRGVVLEQGETVQTTTGDFVSNTGYLKAPYTFTNAFVTWHGLSARFKLHDSFKFITSHPHGYGIDLESGWIRINQDQIVEGEFTNGAIQLPRLAVSDQADNPIKVSYSLLTVQDDLDLFGQVKFRDELFWGEFTQTSPPLRAYSATEPISGYFYLSASHKTPFSPLDSSSFIDPSFSPFPDQLEALGMQGVTFLNPRRFTVFTPDTDGAKPIVFHPFGRSWLNVAAAGVHGEMVIEAIHGGNQIKLGPTSHPQYVAPQPFDATLVIFDKEKKYWMNFQFSDSAVYDCNVNGSVFLGGPVQADFSFVDMQFTSTAHDAGGKIDLSDPVTLDYWGLGVVPKPGMSTAGVLSVKTGQILLTAAGLTEPRHFERPFYLSWGEMLADGNLGRLFFDFNTGGQQFDGFPYTPEAIVLSPYDPANPDKSKAYLKTGGTAHFDFFGPDYLNIHDFNNPNQPGAPFDGRRIELVFDSDHGTHPTDTKISGDWSQGLGTLDFEVRYDESDQDGFVGDGTVGLTYVLDGALPASITMSRDLICISIREDSRHDFTLGPVVHFGSMSRITGCGCIENGQFKRLVLSAELETMGNANVLLRSAAYGELEYLITPTISELRVNGEMYISILVGGDLEVAGSARFAVDRGRGFVEGDIEGRFNTAALLAGVNAEGQLNWHLATWSATDPYQSLQGRLAVEVFAPVGGSSAEGGFYVGMNAPKTAAWVLEDKDSRFKLNMTPLPRRLTGFYGYVKAGGSIDLWVVSGGFEVYAGLGGFVLTPTEAGGVGAQFSGVVLPYVVGNCGIHIWGKILGGLVSAGAWGDLQLLLPYSYGFEGTVGLEACGLWVFCGSVDLTCGLNSAQGFYIE